MNNNQLASMIFYPSINPQALAVLALLQSVEPDFENFKEGVYYYRQDTSEWRNGREKGFSIQVSRGGFPSDVMFIAVFQHKMSNDIVVCSWLGEPSINPPHHSDLGKVSASTRNTFVYGQIMQAAKYVEEIIGKFVKKQNEQEAAAQQKNDDATQQIAEAQQTE